MKQLGTHYDKAAARRSAPKAQYDQLYATRHTLEARVRLLREHGDLQDRDVLLIGDDDLLSIAIEDLIPKKWRPNSITVVDIDRALLEAISDVSRGRVHLMEYDVRKPLPKELRKGFDVVFMDPPYTVAGQQAFLKRATQALRPTHRFSRGIIWSCYSRADLKERSIHAIQTAFVRSGFSLDGLWQHANHYEDARRRKSERRIVGFKSDLFRWVRAPTDRPLRRVGGIYRYHK